MKFLIYTAEPHDANATLDIMSGADKEISRMINILNQMTLDRVLENQTVNLLVNEVEYNSKSEIVTADIYKTTNHGKPLHQLTEDGDGMTIQQILSEHEDAFVPGVIGVKKVNDEVQLIIESNFGSYFSYACRGMDITSHYSADAIQAIQDSEQIGETYLDFDEDYDLTASLFKPPEDEDIREEEGFGNVDLLNKMASVVKLSKSHRMSLDIDRDEWLSNIELFDNLIESGVVKRVRVTGTKDGVVKLGLGGDRAIRESVETSTTGRRGVKEAFRNLPNDN